MDEERIARAKTEQSELFRLIKAEAKTAEIEAQVRKLVAVQTGSDSAAEGMADTIAQQTAGVTSPWFRFFLRHDPRQVLERIRVPVLSLVGELDLQVDPKQNQPEIRKALDLAKNPDVTVRTLAGLNHLFQKAETGNVSEYYTIEETMNPAALKTISEWIVKRFDSVRDVP
jgi:pimeloyl-ACP methyl ester carboxylesterase